MPRYFDLRSTIVIVVGHGLLPEEEDRPLAYDLKREITARAGGAEGRTAVVVTDVWLLSQELGEFFPAIAIGGPAVNEFTDEIYGDLPVLVTRDQEVFVQMAPEASAWRCGECTRRARAKPWSRSSAMDCSSASWTSPGGGSDPAASDAQGRPRGGMLV
jgi:hypothetical protein